MSLTRRQALQLGAAAAVAPVRAFGAEPRAEAPAAASRVRLAVSTAKDGVLYILSRNRLFSLQEGAKAPSATR